MKKAWYAVSTRSRHEFTAKEELSLKDFEVFLPTVERLSARKDRKRTVTLPLFPGYFFVHTTLTPDDYLRIVKTAGVTRLVGYEQGSAVPVSSQEIESIQIVLRGKIPVEKHRYIPEKTPVRILTGPLKGVVGILEEYRGSRKIVVQVDLLRQAVACELTLSDVAPLQPITLLKKTS